MHETHLFKNILKYLEAEEKEASKKIAKIYITLSEFGTINPQHFQEHCRETFSGTKWEDMDIEIDRIPYGPEFNITKIDFAN